MRRALAALAAGCAVASVTAGCGQTRVVTDTVVQTVTAPAVPAETGVRRPALTRPRVREGEVLVSGDTAPKSLGPYRFEPGTYTFRFEQYAPELPGLDFRTESSSINVTLDRSPRKSAPDSIPLVNSPRRTGDNQVQLSGRYYVDVASADHSYVLRFTPGANAAAGRPRL